MSTASTVAALGRQALSFSDALLAGIPAQRFARLPMCDGKPVLTNHPAFVFGHLGLYGPKVAELAGDSRAAERIAAPDAWAGLFGMGAVCQDDPDAAIYPPMDTIVKHYRAGFEAAIAAAEAADETRFAQPNPMERMRKMMPTIGDAVAFMLGSHPMYHLGQVSAWRRLHGLGPAIRL